MQVAAPAQRGRLRLSPAARVAVLTSALVAVGLLLLAGAGHVAAPATRLHVTWWELAPAFALSEVLAFHLEFREEAHSFTLSELPLVVGMYFASPAAILLGRLIGEAAFFGIRRRQPPKKLLFNLSVFLAESAAAVAIFRALSAGRSPLQPDSWAAAGLAVVLADVMSSVAVWQVIRWHGGRPKLVSIAAAAVATAFVNVSLALLAAIVLDVRPLGLVLFAAVGGMIAASYRSYAKLSQRYANLQLLHDFTEAVGSSMRTEAVIEEVLRKARELLRAGMAEVALFDGPDRGGIAYRCSDGPELEMLEPESRDGGWPLAALLEGGQALVVPRSPRLVLEQQLRERLDVRDAIIAPIRLEDDVSGWLMVANRLGEVSSFDEQDRRLFETLANHASVAFQNGRLVEQLRQEAADRRHQALHDALTGLPNRTWFLDRVGSMLGPTGRPCAVILLDLDRFKEVNDTLGHSLGDVVLKEIAGRLTDVVAEPDAVARLGGDEFAVAVAVSGDDDAVSGRAEATASSIIEALARPVVVAEMALEVGASIGIALSPEHGGDAATLLQRADVAMYAAKDAKSGVAVYSFERDDCSPRRLALAGELRSAIEHGEVAIFYQPKARLSDGAVVGAEALVRWMHPRYGLLPPDEFIPVAEATGIISALTTYVLSSAVRQCAQWRTAGLDIGVAVNLAIRSLLDADLPQLVAEVLEADNVPADRLTLELTETSVMADPLRSIGALERLSAIGVRLSVDDFGSGYSSLAYLQRLPVHEVKIDKDFVINLGSSPNDAMIVRSIVELGHNLGLSVVAEGVEDEACWERLGALSCDLAQGYLLSRPVPAEELARWLDERRLRPPALRAARPLGLAGALQS
jgi:diguanylate cyclase (GGDEF)-like protein